MAQVLLSPLSWGLGHAMRDIPIIRTLIAHDHDVTIAACGNALSALKQEFPQCRFIEFEDYPSPYSSGSLFLPKFFLYLPILLRAVSNERQNLAKILSRDRYDLIISDNRLGAYSSNVPSVFISHQLHYHMPLALWPVELFALRVNTYLHQKYDRIIVPDNPPGPLSLAGKLSLPGSDETRSKAFFSGILTSIQKRDCAEDLDYLVLISGPEPQRTKLEEILLPSIHELDGKNVVLLGSPKRKTEITGTDTCTVKGYVSNEEKVDLMNRAKFVICRSGYTTMMELAELKKKHGLFIPTPGQTEQEYLSWYYQKQGWFHSQSQYRLDLAVDLPAAQAYSGFPDMPSTKENVSRLYNDLLAGYLE
ncbi:MAG: glycosyltransferase family 4 protein [Methanoregula sp.]